MAEPHGGTSDEPRRHRLMRGRVPFRVGRLVAAALCALAFLVLARAAEEGGEAGRVFAVDAATQALVRSERSALLDAVMRVVTRVGSGWILIPLTVAALGALWRHHRRLAWFVPIATAGGVLIEGVAKWLVARPRPNLGPHGFPSGHVLASVVFFGAVIYCGGVLPLPRPMRWLGTGVCLLTVMGVAYSRLYLNVHWLTDVLGAFTGGLAYLLVAISVTESLGARRGSARARGARVRDHT